MDEQTNMQKESGMSSKDIIKSYRRQLGQMEKEIGFLQRDKDLREEILEFESGHSKIIDGKPEWVFEEEYMALVIKQKKLQHEINMIQLNDRLEKTSNGILGLRKEIVRLERNGVPKKEEVVETKEKVGEQK